MIAAVRERLIEVAAPEESYARANFSHSIWQRLISLVVILGTSSVTTIQLQRHEGYSSELRTLVPKFHQITLPPQYHSRGVRCALGIDHGPHGEAAMSVVLNDLLLFSCLTALVTGIVIAAATLII